MSVETEVRIEEVFKNAPSPYGIPVISFESNTGDSTIYMAPQHQPANRRAIATLSWIFRKAGTIILVDRPLESYREWAFAKFFSVPSFDDKELFRIEIGPEGFPITMAEL